MDRSELCSLVVGGEVRKRSSGRGAGEVAAGRGWRWGVLAALMLAGWPGRLAAEDGERSLQLVAEGVTVHAGDRVLPATFGNDFEEMLGDDFDGVAEYRVILKRPPRFATAGRMLLEIDGAATAATVRLGETTLGQHLGGWTPFRFDVTDLLTTDQPLRIELDERVGHNTQGFLPIVIPHFGGIWKHVRLIQTAGPIYIDDLNLLLSGFDGQDSIRLEAQLRGDALAELADYEFGYRIAGPEPAVETSWVWHPLDTGPVATAVPRSAGSDQALGSIQQTIIPPQVHRWSPESPYRYQIELAVRRRGDGQIVDRLRRYAAIRHFETRGRELLVNGRAVNIRGLLNWGYAPPRLAPAIDPAAMRAELEFAQQRGFNLMKFCLWVPPQAYLDLADEMGMLTWVEYPTWHPDFSPAKFAELEEEFKEFFYYDRNAASVILRSLTCETGHSAAVDVIQGLYDLGHEIIPGAIIEDDSSWIGWHRVHDFYDDHPYGNNHTWLAKLAELDAHISARDPKPLILGEAIAADTWDGNSNFYSSLNEVNFSWRAAHESLSVADQPRYLQKVARDHRLSDLRVIGQDAKRLALATRKYQIEAFRYRLPKAGYVVSVIRDFPLASMGLIDRAGNAKWSAEDFAWHGDPQLVLNAGSWLRSVVADQVWKPTIHVAGETGLPAGIQLRYQWLDRESGEMLREGQVGCERDARGRPMVELAIPLAAAPEPWPGELKVELVDSQRDAILASNAWDLWVVPEPKPKPKPKSKASGLVKRRAIYVDASVSDAELTALGLVAKGSERITHGGQITRQTPTGESLILSKRLSPMVLDCVTEGARCLLLADGSPGSLATREHWFLRGGPLVAEQAIVKRVNRQMLVELQPFDLAGAVMFDFPLMDEVQPLLSLWDNHDLSYYRSHALLWEARAGAGVIVCSSLNHGEGSGAAGRFLFESLLEYVAGPVSAPALSAETLARLRADSRRQQKSLATADWKFRRAGEADLRGASTTDQWRSEAIGEDAWQPIEITRHWDSQGHGDLDGWGFYRTEVEIPEEWRDQPLFLSFTGVDDYFDVFAGDVLVGQGGDIERRETAFELRISFPLPVELTKQGRVEIGVRVYDWQGAGGIFRPVYLSTEPLAEGPPLLVPPS